MPFSAADILEHLDTAVVVVDRNLFVRQVNPAAENLLGVSAKRALGAPLLPLLDDDETLKHVLASALERGETFAHELVLAPSDVHASSRMVECRVTPRSHADDTDYLLVELIDVTRRMRITREHALQIQHGAGRQMVRQLAHEIKNPLGGLRGAAQLLERQLPGAELSEYTRVIISEADRLAALVDTLLGPGGPPNKQPHNIHELLEYVVRLIEPQASDGLKILREYDPGLPLIAVDRDQFLQAALNLVKNACDSLEHQGTLTIRTRASNNFTIGDVRHGTIASIEIEDDGPGIPPELWDSVFYPLVTSRDDGTGLGLPVAQELISRHGGLVEFESRPGRTVFFIRLPLATESRDAD
ncbi:MAG: PAS domain-containing protein [Woeseia sp.]|nr:PAS domain-containing protein [Woeseia sp.]MBT8096858.1 PAS domain-containing protein [Woeseia sp.]NNE59624.1 PAS domain-containing protein [Woeseia sp.]NNL53876.1 PAS domain-containing protein [Woeseia sp.]